MSGKRSAIPAALQRAVKEESGYRCAIPTCKSTSGLEIAHIVPWREVRVHEFENLITLCAVCHRMYDLEGKIPRQSIQQFKANLSLLHGRYGEFERRLLEQFAQTGHTWIELNTGRELDLYYLLRDRHLVAVSRGASMLIGGFPVAEIIEYHLTDSGSQLVERIKTGAPLN